MARIVAAGAAATSTFALVTALGHDRPSQPTALPVASPAAQIAPNGFGAAATGLDPASADAATTTPGAPVTVAPTTVPRRSAPMTRSTAS